MREYKCVYLTKAGEDRLVNGHPWIYQGDIKSHDDINDGDIVDIKSSKNKYLGSGFFNSHSKITVRLLSRNTNDIFDKDFFKRRVTYALEYRMNVMDDMNAFRLIYGESDELPGLTVDVFNDIVVCQILCLGIELRKEIILDSILEVLSEHEIHVKGLYLRNDVDIRLKEGMDTYKGWYKKELDVNETIICENNLKYYVDFINGQKTGYFLDQKINRLRIRKICYNKKVLDCCTHTGSFAMNAKIGGAKKVVALDISEKALLDAKRNFKLNNLDIDTVCDDLFNYLKMIKKGEYDVIILDPPAFTKSRETIDSALRGYQEINYLAMIALKRGGFLITVSCSHFATADKFIGAINKASVLAGVKLKQVGFYGASPDHPELIGVPETNYLKFYILQVV